MITENVYIIDTVYLDNCKDLKLGEMVEELRKIVKMLNHPNEKLAKLISPKFRGECAVFVKGACRDLDFIYLFRLRQKQR